MVLVNVAVYVVIPFSLHVAGVVIFPEIVAFSVTTCFGSFEQVTLA